MARVPEALDGGGPDWRRLVGLWLSALAAAESALGAARYELAPAELRERRRRLHEEREATLRLLEALARDARWARTLERSVGAPQRRPPRRAARRRATVRPRLVGASRAD
jgi:hypothetical protein